MAHTHAVACLCLPPQVKIQTDEPIYEMVACDLFSVTSKKDTQQIGRMVQLPPAPPPVLYGDTVLPPLIIINLQLPMYQVGGPTLGGVQASLQSGLPAQSLIGD